MQKWESEKHKNWGMTAEGLKGHVATDGSLLGAVGLWGACGWSVVQLDYDEELGPLRGMYGSMEAEFEVQRIIKRAELTAFLCLLKKVIGPIKVHVNNKGIIDGLWRGERKCINPKADDADLWSKIWEEMHLLVSKEILVGVEHVMAHRTNKVKKKMSQFDKFVTQGNEKADELAKEGAVLDEGFMAETRAKTVQQEREEIFAALQYAASFHCLVEEWKDCEELKPKPKEKWIFAFKTREETMHRTEWCAEANKFRCMRCGRDSKNMKIPGKCTRPKYLSENLGKWRKRHLGGHDLVRREVPIWCRKCLGHARLKMGPKLMDYSKPEPVGTKKKH